MKFFRSFSNWAEQGHEFRLSQTKFGVEAKKLLPNNKKNSAGRIIYQGIKIKAAGSSASGMTIVDTEDETGDICDDGNPF